ncbi:MAG: hypothetical protein [Bacteriophage sp.]|nr:MAG: hypothetical protein [Bacteriophage sp.]
MTDNKSNKRVFFLHLRADVNGCGPWHLKADRFTAAKGGRTVAYSYDDKGVTFAVAKVNPTDVYNKAIGRKVSSERLAGGVEGTVGYWPGSVDQFRIALRAGLSI